MKVDELIEVGYPDRYKHCKLEFTVTIDGAINVRTNSQKNKVLTLRKLEDLHKIIIKIFQSKSE